MLYLKSSVLVIILFLFLCCSFTHESSLFDDFSNNLKDRYNNVGESRTTSGDKFPTSNYAFASVTTLGYIGLALDQSKHELSHHFKHIYQHVSDFLSSSDSIIQVPTDFHYHTTIKSVLSSLSTNLNNPAVKFLTRNGMMLILSAKTAHLLYDIYKFESITDTIDKGMNEMRKNLSVEVKPRMNIIVQCLERMADHVGVEFTYNNTEGASLSSDFNDLDDLDDFGDFNEDIGINNENNISYHKKNPPRNYFEHLLHVFSRNYEQVHDLLRRLENDTIDLQQIVEKEKQVLVSQHETSITTVGISTGYLVATSVVSFYVPVLAPIVAAGKLTTVLGSIISLVNGGVAYVTHTQLQERMESLQRLEGFKSEIGIIHSGMIGLNKKLKHFSLQYKQLQSQNKLLFALSRWFHQARVDIGTHISKYRYDLLSGAICTLMMLGLLSYLIKTRKNLEPRKIFILLFVFMALSLMILNFSDTLEGRQFTKEAHISKNLQEFRVEKSIYEERYQAECIWGNMPISRKIALYAKACLYAVLFDSFRPLSVNGTGHLTSDDVCLGYLKRIVVHEEDESKTLYATNVGKVYGGLIKGYFASIVEILIETVDTLAQRSGSVMVVPLFSTFFIAAFIFRRLMCPFCCF